MAPAETPRRRAVGPVSQCLLIAVLVAAGALVWWGRDVTLTAIATGNGVIATKPEPVRVATPSDGRLAPHDVQAGMHVVQGQLLFRIEQVTETLVEGEAGVEIAALRAVVARLSAEAGGAGRVDFPDVVAGTSPAAQEAGRFDTRRRELNRAQQALRDAVASTRLEIAEQKAAAERHRKARDLAREELAVLGPLVDRGISPKLEFLRVQQKVQEMEALRERAMLAVPRLESRLRETERQRAQLEKDFRDAARQGLREARDALAEAQRKNKTLERRVTATEIRAPVAGSIRQVIGAPGATVRAGQTVAVLLPKMDEIFIDARIPAASRIGSKVGEQAVVTYFPGRVTASVPTEIVAVAPQAGGRQRQIKLRVGAERQGFEEIATYDGDLQVTLRARQPILDYLLDRLSVASGGRIRDMLFGR